VNELKGNINAVENFSKFINFEKIKKYFDIKNDEIQNDGGIMGAVYNRIALKDL